MGTSQDFPGFCGDSTHVLNIRGYDEHPLSSFRLLASHSTISHKIHIYSSPSRIPRFTIRPALALLFLFPLGFGPHRPPGAGGASVSTLSILSLHDRSHFTFFIFGLCYASNLLTPQLEEAEVWLRNALKLTPPEKRDVAVTNLAMLMRSQGHRLQEIADFIVRYARSVFVGYTRLIFNTNGKSTFIRRRHLDACPRILNRSFRQVYGCGGRGTVYIKDVYANIWHTIFVALISLRSVV